MDNAWLTLYSVLADACDIFNMFHRLKGVKPQLLVNVLSEFCFPFLRGCNFAYIAAIEYEILHENSSDSINCDPSWPNRRKMRLNRYNLAGIDGCCPAVKAMVRGCIGITHNWVYIYATGCLCNKGNIRLSENV